MKFRGVHLGALFFSIAFHAFTLTLLQSQFHGARVIPLNATDTESVVEIETYRASVPEKAAATKSPLASEHETWHDLGMPTTSGHLDSWHVAATSSQAPPLIQPPPPAPTQAEWALAARYTLKNSKAYRYALALQIRSGMGPAVGGSDQGAVRFRFHVAPSGWISALETLWSTSDSVEKKARAAIAAMPLTPPTPTGKPLIFEKTIVFSPFSSELPPSYRDDCKPETPSFKNQFSWDGHAPQVGPVATVSEEPSQESIEDCEKQIPPETVEEATGRDQRELSKWDSPRLAR